MDVARVDSTIVVEARYATPFNFMGEALPGYGAPRALLRREAAVALARGNERRTMEFRPAGANRLAARVDFPFDGKFRATVTLRGPGGDLGQARFNVDATR